MVCEARKVGPPRQPGPYFYLALSWDGPPRPPVLNTLSSLVGHIWRRSLCTRLRTAPLCEGTVVSKSVFRPTRTSHSMFHHITTSGHPSRPSITGILISLVCINMF